jgi:hypothetical protein
MERGQILPVCLVAGNKCDLQSMRQVGAREGLEWARTRGFGFMETSAREMVNIEETFACTYRRVWVCSHTTLTAEKYLYDGLLQLADNTWKASSQTYLHQPPGHDHSNRLPRRTKSRLLLRLNGTTRNLSRRDGGINSSAGSGLLTHTILRPPGLLLTALRPILVSGGLCDMQ